nr:MAG TPA: hypothetical protein [Caudoviricetes sp.]
MDFVPRLFLLFLTFEYEYQRTTILFVFIKYILYAAKVYTLSW